VADVLIIVGSESDKPRIEPAFEVLSEAGVSYEFHVSSAHRQPDQTADLVKGARKKGFRVVIAGAGSRRRSRDSPLGHRSPRDRRTLRGRAAERARCAARHRTSAGGVPVACVGIDTPRTPLSSRSVFSRPDVRVGIGYDSHRFAEGEGRTLILGGVEIPHPRGWSDTRTPMRWRMP